MNAQSNYTVSDWMWVRKDEYERLREALRALGGRAEGRGVSEVCEKHDAVLLPCHWCYVDALRAVADASRTVRDGFPFLLAKPPDYGGDWIPFVEALDALEELEAREERGAVES